MSRNAPGDEIEARRLLESALADAKPMHLPEVQIIENLLDKFNRSDHPADITIKPPPAKPGV
jgi:hypothetical protein